MSNFCPLEVVDRDSETKLQLSEIIFLQLRALKVK